MRGFVTRRPILRYRQNGVRLLWMPNPVFGVSALRKVSGLHPRAVDLGIGMNRPVHLRRRREVRG